MVNFNNDILSITDILFLYSLNNTYINNLLDSITTDNYQEIKDEIKKILEKNIKEVKQNEEFEKSFVILQHEFEKLKTEIKSTEPTLDNSKNKKTKAKLISQIWDIRHKFSTFQNTRPVLTTANKSNISSLNEIITKNIKECNDLLITHPVTMERGGTTVKKNLLKKKIFSKKNLLKKKIYSKKKFKKKKFNF